MVDSHCTSGIIMVKSHIAWSVASNQAGGHAHDRRLTSPDVLYGSRSISEIGDEAPSRSAMKYVR